MNESDLRSDVHYLGSSENKAWKKKKKKNSGLYEIWTHDLCDTGANSVQSGNHLSTLRKILPKKAETFNLSLISDEKNDL